MDIHLDIFEYIVCDLWKFNISNHLEVYDIRSLIMTNSQFVQIFSYETFWIYYYKKSFGDHHSSNITWKENYRQVYIQLSCNPTIQDKIHWLIKNHYHPHAWKLLKCILTDENENRFLVYASKCGCVEIVENLCKYGVNVDKLDNVYNCSPLYIASQDGRDKVVKILLDYKADYTIDFEGYQPLYTASRNGHHNIIKLLYNAGADVNIVHNNSNDNSTPLYVACQDGQYRSVKTLLEYGADQTITYLNGFTPLYIACYQGHYKVVRLLYDNDNTLINNLAPNGDTPLKIALDRKHQRVIKFLRKNGGK